MIQFKHAEQQSQGLYANTKRRSSVGFNSDVDEHILTNNVPSTHRHLKPVHPLSRRQCHATRRDRTPDPLNLLCKVHSMHTRALWRSITTLSHSSSKTQRRANHNCNERHPLPLPRRQCHTTQQGPHDLLFTYREYLD